MLSTESLIISPTPVTDDNLNNGMFKISASTLTDFKSCFYENHFTLETHQYLFRENITTVINIDDVSIISIIEKAAKKKIPSMTLGLDKYLRILKNTVFGNNAINYSTVHLK